MAKKRPKSATAPSGHSQIVGHHPSLPGVVVRVTMIDKETCLIERTPYRYSQLSRYDGRLIESHQKFADLTAPLDQHQHLLSTLLLRPAEWPGY